MTLPPLLLPWLPALITLLVIVLVLGLGHWRLIHRVPAAEAERLLPRQLLMLGLTVVGVLALVLALPLSETTQGQILSLLGVVVAGVIAIAATGFVSNAMAGLMLRAVETFRPGDFIQTDDTFGRVIQRGLFHTEVQTEDRDLTALPNLFLVTHPVTVIHHDGTIVSTELSLGYDIPIDAVEALLIDAAEKAGLEEPFVQVRELGSYAVTYRVAGFLPEVKQLLTVRSNLRREVMHAFHRHEVEIVSPTLMNQRQLDPETRILPPNRTREPDTDKGTATPEALIFDKANEAAQRERARDLFNQLQEELTRLQATGKQAPDEETKKRIQARARVLEHRAQALDAYFEENSDKA